MTERIKHGGTSVTINDDGTTEVVSDDVTVSVYRGGQVVVNWDHPLPRTMLDAGPDDPMIHVHYADGTGADVPSRLNVRRPRR